MLVHRMVKKVKDSKVWAKINTKDESDRLESLKRQLAQAKQTGGDKDYEKELEDEIKELEAQYQREGLTKDADPRGYKVSDQIIKGFLIYKSGKGPATYFAKNENGKEFEGSMEEIKKQIDAYWVKQDEDVMKQKVRDAYFSNYLFKYKNLFVSTSGERYIARTDAGEIVAEGKNKEDIIRNIDKYNSSKTKDDLHSEAKPWAKKVLLAMRDIYKSSGDDNIYDLFNDAMGRVSPPSSLKAIIRIYILSGANFGYSEGVIFKGASAGYLDSKTKDKAYHPRWRIKDDKLFRLRSAIKKAKTKDVELSNRAVWRKEDFDKMVAAGNFTIVSKQPWGYEVKVKSGNIYGVEIKDTYTKGSADGKTKDDYRSMSLEELQDKAKQGYFELQSDPKLRNHVEIKYPNGKREWIFVEKLAKDKYTGDPLTKKGNKILAKMRERYGKKKGTSVFYASKNKGTITGVDGKTKDVSAKEIQRQIGELKRRSEDKTLSKQQREYYKEKLKMAEGLFAAYNPVWKSKGQYDSREPKL